MRLARLRESGSRQTPRTPSFLEQQVRTVTEVVETPEVGRTRPSAQPLARARKGRCRDHVCVAGDIPSSEIRIVLPTVPVSLQGSSEARTRLREMVQEQTQRLDLHLTGEVELQVEWLLHEKHRWDTPGVLRSPDLDNIVKPVLDGLCGPRGVLIDDCQLQTLMCTWIDWPNEAEQQLSLRLRPLMVDESVSGGPIIGLEMSDGPCWVTTDDLPPEIHMRMLDFVRTSREVYEEMLGQGVPPQDAKYFLPAARRFHRRQLERHGFRVVPFDDYVAELRERAAVDG
jgi:Holliday junction resolvase RusA-like endonuclease